MEACQPLIYRSKTAILISLLALAQLIPGAMLYGDSIRSYQATQSLEPTKKRLKEFLQGFDSAMYEDEDTAGMQWRSNTGFWSAFNYDIYAGSVAANNPTTLIRLEGDSGDVLTMGRILEQEKIILEGAAAPPYDTSGIQPQKLEEKNHFYSQGLNLIAPWLSVLHASWNSPRLTTGQTVFRFVAYFLFDGLMVWAGGTGLWQEPFNAEKYGGSIVAALALPRMIGAMQHANLIRGHNRIARLGYTFYLD